MASTYTRDSSAVCTQDAIAANKRDPRADVLKAIAIYGVVFIHAGGAGDFSAVAGSLFRCAVPIFLIFFGYFAEISIARRGNARAYLTRRGIHLLIPFVAWSAFYWFVIPPSAQRQGFALVPFLSSIGYAWPGQYFFVLLLQIVIFFPLIRLLASSSIFSRVWLVGSVVVISVLCYGIHLHPVFPWLVEKFGTRTCLLWMIYPILGIRLARSGVPCFSKAALLVLFLLPLEEMILSAQGVNADPYLRPMVVIGSVVFFITVMGGDFERIPAPFWLQNLIKMLASNTMGIFVMNPLVLACLWSFLAWWGVSGIPGESVVIRIVFTVIVVLICLLLAGLLKRLKLGILVSS